MSFDGHFTSANYNRTSILKQIDRFKEYLDRVASLGANRFGRAARWRSLPEVIDCEY